MCTKGAAHCLLLSSYLAPSPHPLEHHTPLDMRTVHPQLLATKRGKCQGSGFWFCGCFDERLASGSQPLPFACQTVKVAELSPSAITGPSGWTLYAPSLGPNKGAACVTKYFTFPSSFFTSSFCSFLVEGEVYRALFFPINQHVRHIDFNFP